MLIIRCLAENGSPPPLSDKLICILRCLPGPLQREDRALENKNGIVDVCVYSDMLEVLRRRMRGKLRPDHRIPSS